VAEYPITTQQPHHGVVSVGPSQGFVVADITGLIEGAAEGAGLGIQFLKHVSRTSLLLHLVDVAPLDAADPVEQVRIIEGELRRHDPELLQRPRWLLLNKIDLWAPEEREANARNIITQLDWQAPWFAISAAERLATREVCLAAQRFFDERKADAGESAT
jgi:GTP-binding protein